MFHKPNASPTETNSIPPGAVIGILGGGQLGRMLAIAGRRMGYGIHVFDPDSNAPARGLADCFVCAGFEDLAAVRSFASAVNLVVYEFENIPRAALEEAALVTLVRPRPEVLHICQNREREKVFLRSRGIPCAPFRVVDSAAALATALGEIGTPAVLKTADFGYDGKGQVKIGAGDDLPAVWAALGAPRGVLEAWISHRCELSVVVARGVGGDCVAFPPAENIHRNHILDLSIVPGRFSADVSREASRLACRVAEELGLTGLLAVEFFLCDNGDLIVNELAPRPHNSGHFTFDACVTSQFEQHLRAACGYALGSPQLLSPVVMWNLLGDVPWNPDWSRVFQDPGAKLHLYGKAQARPGRKMGHVCLLAPGIDEALARIETLRQTLNSPVS